MTARHRSTDGDGVTVSWWLRCTCQAVHLLVDPATIPVHCPDGVDRI